MPMNARLFERPPWNQRWFLYLLAGLLIAVDYLVLPNQLFPLLFIFPVMLAAWNRGFWRAAVFTVVLQLIRNSLRFLPEDSDMTGRDLAITLTRLTVLLLLAWLVAVIAKLTQQLRHRVRQLEGLLPICAGCKAIRDDRGNWIRLERYISGHSEATFTHGLCPDCLKKYYSDVLPDTPHEGL